MKRISILFCVIILVYAMKDDTHKGFDLKTFEKSLAYIPMGSYMFNDSSSDYNDDIKGKAGKTGKMVSLSAFYMCNHVVSNSEYHEFLNDLKQSNGSLYTQMLPDTTVWRDKSFYNEPYVKYYFQHPAYQDYPVVGITHEQAEYYCKWLTDKYMNDPKRKFKKARIMLPTVYQWEYAANGGLAMGQFPWPGSNMHGADGHELANFLIVPEANIKRKKVYVKDSSGAFHEHNYAVASNIGYSSSAPTIKNAADIITPVISYRPNGYGLYNMAGNVKEYVSEKGITKGGSWKEYGYYLQNWIEQPYDTASMKATDDRGFRIIMMTKEE